MKQLFLTLCLFLATQFSYAELKAPASKQPISELGPNFSGKVTETMKAASYTYVLLDTGKQQVWVAAMEFAVKKGDTVAVSGGMPMKDFHSKTLNRDFDVVYFAAGAQVNGKLNKTETTELPAGHPSVDGEKSELPKGHPPLPAANAIQKIGKIQKAAGGKTIADVYAEKMNLKGKPIAVRGKVVKYNANILGKNWLHIQDGTGKPGSDDLVVITDSKSTVGDTVLVNGKVSTDRDFGSGYKFDVMVEDAKVKVE